MKAALCPLLLTLLTVQTFAQPGTPDTAFGVNGKATVSGAGVINALAVQPDGKILAVGLIKRESTDEQGYNVTEDFAVWRFNVDGTPDTSFGAAGLVTTDFGAPYEVASSLAIQPDGRVVVAGASRTALSGLPRDPISDFVLARYEPNGALDTSFGGGGKVVTDFYGGTDVAKTVLLRTDGKIIAVGEVFGNDVVDPILGEEDHYSVNFGLARYNPDGTPDTSFDGDGKLGTELSAQETGCYSRDVANAAVIQSDGKIIVAGDLHELNCDGGAHPVKFTLVRYNADGTLDSGFGSGGIISEYFPWDIDYYRDRDEVRSHYTSFAEGVAIQPNGKIVGVGSGMARFNADGSLDWSFGTKGLAEESDHAVAVQPDGRILLGGPRRLHSDGTPDYTFGVNGSSTGGGSHAIALQADGKILTAGGTEIARFNSNIKPCAELGFTAASTPVGQGPHSVATGDFNRDDRLDLAVENGVGNNVSVLLGDGAGGFGAAANFPVGSSPYFVAVGDFNSDYKQDLATANRLSNNVSILLGDGAGGFGPAANFAVGSRPRSIAVGDFNADFRQDLAVVNQNSNNVSVLLGNGAGGFGAAVNHAVGSSPVHVVAADFNSDGRLDLAVTNSLSDTVSILLGNAAGGFGAPTNVAAGLKPFGAAAVDLNADGKLDLAVTNVDANTVSVLLGDGSGGFSATSQYSVGSQPRSVAVGDIDGDGRQDLATANPGGDSVSVLFGDGGGAFGPATAVPVSGNPWTVRLADFDLDGRFDMVTAELASNKVSILSAGCKGPSDLMMAKSHGGFFRVNSNDFYTLVVRNVGAGDSQGAITVSDTLPEGLTYVSAVGAGWDCNSAGQAVACTRGKSLTPGESSGIRLMAAVSLDADDLTNTATLSNSSDSNPGNNTASDFTRVTRLVDLSVTMQGTPAEVSQGDPVSYTVGVSNAGPNNAREAKVFDFLPDGALFDASKSSTQCKSIQNGTWVECDIGNLATGATTNVTIVLSYASAGRKTNEVEVSFNDEDPDYSNNTARAYTDVYTSPVGSVELNPGAVTGTKTSTATVTLGIPAPAGGAVVQLASGNTSVATVPAGITIPAGATVGSFTVKTKAVPSTSTAEIHASYGDATKSATLTVLPPVLTGLAISPATVTGPCQTSTGRVTLNAKAPSGGAVVTLTNTNGGAGVPAAVTVPAGSTSVSFTVTTFVVAAKQSGAITANYNGASFIKALTVLPLGVKSLSAAPLTGTGPYLSTATVTLTCPAPAGGQQVLLSTSKATAAAPVDGAGNPVTSVTVAEGQTSATFRAQAYNVVATTYATITAKANGLAKAIKFTVN